MKASVVIHNSLLNSVDSDTFVKKLAVHGLIVYYDFLTFGIVIIIVRKILKIKMLYTFQGIVDWAVNFEGFLVNR